MLACGQCLRRGKNTIVAVTSIWRYRVIKNNDSYIFTLDEEFTVPDDICEETSFVSGRCARCGNDFFLPISWIKKGAKRIVKVKGLNRKPVCTQCQSKKDFLIVGLIPFQFKESGNYMSLTKIVNDRHECVTDMAAVILAKELLVDEDLRIPIVCRECTSSEVDLIPVNREFAFSAHDFDVGVVGESITE